jgi:hypothetical protein
VRASIRGELGYDIVIHPSKRAILNVFGNSFFW